MAFPTESAIVAEMVKQMAEMGVTAAEAEGMLIRHAPGKSRASQRLAAAAAEYLAQLRNTPAA